MQACILIHKVVGDEVLDAPFQVKKFGDFGSEPVEFAPHANMMPRATIAPHTTPEPRMPVRCTAFLVNANGS